MKPKQCKLQKKQKPFLEALKDIESDQAVKLPAFARGIQCSKTTQCCLIRSQILPREKRLERFSLHCDFPLRISRRQPGAGGTRGGCPGGAVWLAELRTPCRDCLGVIALRAALPVGASAQLRRGSPRRHPWRDVCTPPVKTGERSRDASHAPWPSCRNEVFKHQWKLGPKYP